MFWKQHRCVPYDVMLSSKTPGKEKQEVWGTRTHIHAYRVCLPKQMLKVCYFHSISQVKGRSERLGRLLFGYWLGSTPQNNKFLIRNGRRDFQRYLLFPNLPRRGHVWIIESLRLEIPPGSSSATFNQIPPCSQTVTSTHFLNTCSSLEKQLRLMSSYFLNKFVKIQFPNRNSLSDTIQQSSPVSEKGAVV